MNNNRGQIQMGIIISAGLALVAGMASYFGAINAQESSVAVVRQNVAVNTNEIINLKATVLETRDDVKLINQNVNLLLISQGIKPKK